MPQPKFPSRRSTVYSTKGIVTSTQPLANAAGIKILEKGGNAIDAAVAVAAALGVTETASTDLGGDAFVLFYDNKEKKVHGLNGTGRSAKKLTLDFVLEHKEDILHNRLKANSIFSVNVPGAVAAWYDAIEKWGSGNVSFSEVLQPAISLAEDGYPISELSARLYHDSQEQLKKVNADKSDEFRAEELSLFLPNENLTSPKTGQVLNNKYLADTLKTIANEGKDGFYKGEIAQSIVDEVQSRGGLLELSDLQNHSSLFVEPISLEFLGKKLWEIPPNGSGIIALLTLGLIKSLAKSKQINLDELKHNSTEYLHLIIETLKLSFKDSEEYVSDHDHLLAEYNIDANESILKLLSSELYFEKRSESFKSDSVLNNEDLQVGSLPNESFQSDTVYFTVSDKDGNAASFINSVFHNFGSGILVPKRGFFLQNRGANFSLHPGSKNVLEGGKRSYHTIIPGLITSPLTDGKEELYASYGIQGGFNQPQAHVQVYFNLLLFGLDPQEALDAPRISLTPHPDLGHTDEGHGSNGPVSRSVTVVNVEEGIGENVIEGLRNLGHDVKVVTGYSRSLFGRGQIIRKESVNPLVYSAGSDPRGDGAAVPFF
jgi:gamma-glutamyltranspeptidase/glutathione hydrolase